MIYMKGGETMAKRIVEQSDFAFKTYDGDKYYLRKDRLGHFSELDEKREVDFDTIEVYMSSNHKVSIVNQYDGLIDLNFN
jgi:hypothetical protein